MTYIDCKILSIIYIYIYRETYIHIYIYIYTYRDGDMFHNLAHIPAGFGENIRLTRPLSHKLCKIPKTYIYIYISIEYRIYNDKHLKLIA